jgi:PhzF family phenazine biosynthesis protein
MKIPFFQVDAFASNVFEGNPAGVCLLDQWLPDALLQSIAAENNLSETAYLVSGSEGYELRWFTPEAEIDLCGHATLACAHVIFENFQPEAERLEFATQSGLLSVRRGENHLFLNFPARKPEPVTPIPDLREAFGQQPMEVYQARDLMAVFENQSAIESLLPDMNRIRQIDAVVVVATAPGDQVDFVSRCFAPRFGVPEDPVTGSAHCSLIPYWAERLGKESMTARQLSRRGGELECELKPGGLRVSIGGKAITYMTGELQV